MSESFTSMLKMSEAYSYDLRLKVLAALDNGMKKTEASRVFSMSRNTIDLWLARRAETGDCQACSGYQTGSGHKITDWEKFRTFAQEHGDKTQTEMAQLWGESISQRTISRALRRIGLARKKDLRLLRTQRS